MEIHQPIAGQQVRCSCGAENDLEDGLSPSLPSSPAHDVVGHELCNADVPVLQGEKQFNEAAVNKVSDKPNENMQSKSDTLSALAQQKKLQEPSNTNSAALEKQYAPEIQLKYKDSNKKHTHSYSHEPKTPFVPGFQSIGHNYNMPDHLIKWQADQFERSERRHRKQLAVSRNANDVPVYLSKEPGKVPMPVVRSKSTQYKTSDVGQQENHGVQKELSAQKASSNKAKAAETEVTF